VELRQMTTFLMVARHLSFTRAAHELGYVQSSVTAQIKALESDLGVALFERLGRRVVLTQAGRELRRHAQDLLERAEQARSEVRAAHGRPHEPNGILHIAAPGSLCAYRLPGVLRRLQVRFPRLNLAFGPAGRTEVLDGLTDGSLDIGFLLEESVAAPMLVVETLAEEPLRLVAAPDHPLAGVSRVATADLGACTMLLPEPDCSQRMLIEREFQAAGIRPVVMEFVGVEAQMRCAAEGLGVALVPVHAAAEEIGRGGLAVLPWEHAPTLGIHLARHKNRTIPALDTLAATAREHWG
jgi:DNA-binding transcriptional LysR family regulator